MKVEPCEDYGYLSKLSGFQVAELRRPSCRYYLVTHENVRRGAFLVISQAAAPDLHVLLTIKGKLALEAVRAVCELIYQDCQTNQVNAWIPIEDKKTRCMAIAAGFERVSCNGRNAFYVRTRR